MWIYRAKRGKTFGTFNFDAYQIYACELLRLQKSSSLGISVQHCSVPGEVPFVMNRDQALSLASFIEALPEAALPTKHKVSGGLPSYFSNLYISFRNKDGLSFSGRIASGNALGARFNTVTVSKKTLDSFATTIREMYKLA